MKITTQEILILELIRGLQLQLSMFFKISLELQLACSSNIQTVTGEDDSPRRFAIFFAHGRAGLNLSLNSKCCDLESNGNMSRKCLVMAVN